MIFKAPTFHWRLCKHTQYIGYHEILAPTKNLLKAIGVIRVLSSMYISKNFNSSIIMERINVYRKKIVSPDPKIVRLIIIERVEPDSELCGGCGCILTSRRHMHTTSWSGHGILYMCITQIFQVIPIKTYSRLQISVGNIVYFFVHC